MVQVHSPNERSIPGSEFVPEPHRDPRRQVRVSPEKPRRVFGAAQFEEFRAAALVAQGLRHFLEMPFVARNNQQPR